MQARSRLYARRLQGDLDLGLEPARIDGAGDRQWARSDFPGGKLPGGSDQTIMEESATQNFRIGTRRTEHGWTFRYSKAAGDLGGLNRLVINSNFCPGCTGHEDEDGFEGVLNSAATAGDRYVDLADTVARAANYYQGGHFIAFSAGHYQQYYIVSSDAGNGTYVRCYLSEPLVTDILITDGVTAYLSPYSAVMAAMSTLQEYEPFIGTPLIPVTSGYWFWLLTEGPVCITPHGGTWPGQAAHYRDVFAWMDGTIDPASVADPTSGYQRVGYLLSATVNGYGDMWIMLQLE